MPKKDRPRKPTLNDRQKLFVEHYVKQPNAHRAAREAGYSEDSIKSTAHDIMSNPVVKEQIQLKLEERLRNVGITFEGNLEILMNMVKGCMAGKASEKGLIHPGGVSSGVDLINKMAGFYAQERRETDINSKVRLLVEEYQENV